MLAEDSLSEKVVEAVASAEGRDPLDLDPPLYHAINPDALEALFRNTTGEVTFTYLGYTVHIAPDQKVTVE